MAADECDMQSNQIKWCSFAFDYVKTLSKHYQLPL